MKKLLVTGLFVALVAAACDGWSYTVPTFSAPPPTVTPSILSPTPLIVTVTRTAAPAPATGTPSPTATYSTPTTTISTPSETATVPTEAPTLTGTPTLPAFSPDIIVEVLGCNTSFDVFHGMGEVTNAFATLKNNTGAGMADLCTTLYALDEGRAHPDKTVCVPSLEHGQQVTLKLTVDSTYRQTTPIQVEVKSGDALLTRIGQESCSNIGLFAPAPASLLTPIPIQ